MADGFYDGYVYGINKGDELREGDAKRPSFRASKAIPSVRSSRVANFLNGLLDGRG